MTSWSASLQAVSLLPLLSALPTFLLLLYFPFRLWQLRGASVKVLPNRRGFVKLLIAITLSALQLDVWKSSISSPDANKFSLLSAAASFVASLCLCHLSFLEHARSVQPADFIVLYLLASSAYAAAQLVKPIFYVNIPVFQPLTILQLCLRLLLLIAECRSKRPILRDAYCQLPPEQTVGILNRTFFWWINAVLARGSESILTNDDLPSIDSKLSSQALREDILLAWDQRAKSESKWTLPKVLGECLFSPLCSAILPRLFLILFRYAQPILISKAIRYISRPFMLNETLEEGVLIVLMATIIYVGMAISTAVYQHRLNRLKIMIRGSLVGLVYAKSLTMRSGIYDDGRAVTLMSSDADSLGTTAQMFHETWARVAEVLIGMTMLAREVGWVWPVPLIIIFFCSRMSRYLATHLQAKQKDWNVTTQKRIAVTSSMLSSMKGLKMLGMTGFIETHVQNLRLQEIDMAKKVRWMRVAYNASANALGIFSPILTLVLFAFLARMKNSEIDTETAFTTIAILGMVTHPANMIMTIVPQAVASLSSFERIQQYLLESPRSDQRQFLQNENASSVTTSPAILIEKMTILDPSSHQPILRNIDLHIDAGSIVMCAGPVGSGKTALSKAILGEIPIADGKISVASKNIGLCAQSPWLPSTTIREAICGFSSQMDKSWYNEVVSACCLDADLLAFPDGDETLIGSRGLNLSGGQRHRVALARVVYARCEIVILDDSFSALDGKTENSIIDNLLGPNGLLTKNKSTTVFLITNATQHFRLADWIVVLGGSQIKEQGTWVNMVTKTEHLAKAMLKDGQESVDDDAPKKNSNIQIQQQRAADAAMDLSRKTGDLTLYNYYFKSIGYKTFCIMVACTATYSFFIIFPQWWLKWWTEAGPSGTWFYMGGYLLLSLIAWTSTNGIMWSTIIRIAPQSGVVLHSRLLTTVIRAPLSYFSTTDTGVILNRFSQDIQLIDKELPSDISDLFVQTFKLLMQEILLLGAQKLMTVTLPFCICIVYIVQKIYLRTSRQLRFLELESRSAVYSSFLETVEGIATIRAFDWEKEVEHDNIVYLDRSQQPFYLLLCLQRWLNIVLELVVAGIAIGVVALAVVLRGTTTGGQIGIALNIVILANVTLVRLVDSWTSLEISLAAIARLKSLESDTPKEDKPGEDLAPLETWPSSGAVEFKNVTVAYNPDAVALRDINFTVAAGQKLVICGRTGSGKSTLLLSLLRLVDTQFGTIKIDGIDLSRVPRSLIRQRCFITVPQDPLVLGHASLRFNLDPSLSLSDEEIMSALKKTGLWVHLSTNASSNSVNSVGNEVITAAAEIQDVLDCLVSSLPHMSTGQSQLFSLTRAIIQAQYVNRQTSDLFPYHQSLPQTKPILLLDEATSSLDPITESVMHDIINEEFTLKGHTVIVVAHRLSAVAKHMRAGQDVVAWMANGRIERIGAVDDILESGIPS